MTASSFLLRWVHTLTGLEPPRVQRARDEIASWRHDHPARRLLAEDLDTAVAATLLVEGIAKLAEAGVPIDQIQRKLRLDKGLRGAWAEVRAADLLLRVMGPKVALRLEEGKSRGAHADFRFAFPGSPDARSIELKAVGLSDAEIGFCERMAPLLESLLPLDGIVHLHAGIDQDLADISPEAQRSMKQAAVLSARVIQHHPAGLRGTTIVGHGAEANYARRVSLRVIQEAVEQLPVADECWVAVYWSNGAPMDDVRAVIPWEEIPSHIHGLVLLGCGVILGDPQFHCFSSRISRRARKADKTTVRSSHPREHEAAALALEAFERSSGVRPTLLKVGKRTLLRRDGNERIMPFNLLAAWDPPGVGRSDDMPSWMS